MKEKRAAGPENTAVRVARYFGGRTDGLRPPATSEELPVART